MADPKDSDTPLLQLLATLDQNPLQATPDQKADGIEGMQENGYHPYDENGVDLSQHATSESEESRPGNHQQHVESSGRRLSTRKQRIPIWGPWETEYLIKLKVRPTLSRRATGRFGTKEKVWERICREFKGTFPEFWSERESCDWSDYYDKLWFNQITDDQCQRRWETLVKSFRKIKKFCDDNNKTFDQITRIEFESMKLPTARYPKETWYEDMAKVVKDKKPRASTKLTGPPAPANVTQSTLVANGEASCSHSCELAPASPCPESSSTEWGITDLDAATATLRIQNEKSSSAAEARMAIQGNDQCKKAQQKRISEGDVVTKLTTKGESGRRSIIGGGDGS